MINAIVLLLGCQLAGEITVTGLGLPLPGPVVGMILLFIGLAVHGRVSEPLGNASDGLLSHLGLLFVPAGVGILGHLDAIRDNWLALTGALVLSTVAAMTVTALVFKFTLKLTDDHDGTRPEQA